MSAPVAWLILVLAIIGYVVGYDLSAHFTHTYSMTDQMRAWLASAYIGPFIFGAWVGIPAALTYHWFVKGRGG